jgi:hypothetical protein
MTVGQMTRARPVSHLSVLVTASFGLLVACSDSDEIDAAQPPDLSMLAAAYDNPTGTIQPSELACRAQDAFQQLTQERLPEVRAAISDALVSLREWLQSSGLPLDGTTIDDKAARVRAVVNVHRICRGWDANVTTPNASKDGRIELSAYVDTQGLHRTLWGQAINCQGRVSPAMLEVPVFLNGTLAIYLQQGLRSGGETTFTVQLSGEVGGPDNRHPVNWDFSASTEGLEIRLPTADGHVIASIQNGIGQLRTAAGEFAFDEATAAACDAQTMAKRLGTEGGGNQ